MPNITVAKLVAQDGPEWEELFRQYLNFYERTLEPTPYHRAWRPFKRPPSGMLSALASFRPLG